jgi:hypothetical protein
MLIHVMTVRLVHMIPLMMVLMLMVMVFVMYLVAWIILHAIIVILQRRMMEIVPTHLPILPVKSHVQKMQPQIALAYVVALPQTVLHGQTLIQEHMKI